MQDWTPKKPADRLSLTKPAHFRVSEQKGERIGYARVSTEDQNVNLQIDALERAGCISIHHEKLSARAKYRPKLELALAALEPGDTLVVWRLDRLARNMRDLFNRLQQISDAGAEFMSLTEAFETKTAGGRFLLHVMGAVAELESQLTAQRTAAGMRAFADRGGHLGATRKVDDRKRAKIVRLCQLTGKREMSIRQICKACGIAIATFHLNFPGGRGNKPSLRRGKPIVGRYANFLHG